MNKTELVKKISDRMNLSQKDIKEIVDLTLDIISEAVAQGDDVTFSGFGTFVRKRRAQRQGVKPVTKEVITIKERNVPVFKPSIVFKQRVNE